jgi:non-ribosomal peptide synthetase-like protein
MSLLPDNTVIPEGRGCCGSPATVAEVHVPARSKKQPGWGKNFAFGVIHLALIYAMGYILLLSAAPAIALIGYALYVDGPLMGVGIALAAVPVSFLWYLQLVILVKDLAIGRIFPGTYSVHSVAYLRYWFLRYLLDNTRQIVLPLYATVFLPRFLRQLGAKVGRTVEISTIMHAVPDLIELDDESFLSDACIVGSHRIYGGVIELRTNKVGKRAFVGNSALVPAGVELGNNGLVGVMSTPPAGVTRTKDDTRWYGSPSFELPYIPPVTGFTDRQTFEPTRFLVVMRALVELLRLLLPGLIAVIGIILFCTAIVALYRSVPLYQLFLIGPVISLGASFSLLIWIGCLKRLLMGRFVPTVKPLWSPYVWFNDVVNALHETVAANVLTPMLGTPFASSFLRLMGCTVGRWVFLESTLFSEFDLVKIGDRASLNLGCTIQPHLFEDRIMKADSIVIGTGCSIGNMAVVLYGTVMHGSSSLGPLSVLMKGEDLPGATRWFGIPTQHFDSPIQPFGSMADDEIATA